MRLVNLGFMGFGRCDGGFCFDLGLLEKRRFWGFCEENWGEILIDEFWVDWGNIFVNQLKALFQNELEIKMLNYIDDTNTAMEVQICEYWKSYYILSIEWKERKFITIVLICEVFSILREHFFIHEMELKCFWNIN